MKLKVSLMVLMLLSFKSFAEMTEKDDKTEGASLFGDFRFRYLTGSDSSKAVAAIDETSTPPGLPGQRAVDRSGSMMQLRFRPGFKYRLGDGLSFKGRLRTVMNMAPGGSYQTMGGDFAPKTVGLDLAYVKAKVLGVKVKLGKQPMPFWKQNEIYWDDDVTPEGMTFSKAFHGPDKAWKVRPVFGYYIVRSAGLVNSKANDDFSNKADKYEAFEKDRKDMTMMAMQLNGKVNLGMDSKIKFGLGMLNLDNVPTVLRTEDDTILKSDVNQVTNKEGRDYSLMIVSAGWKSMFGTMPWGVGFDYISNGGDVKDEYVIDKEIDPNNPTKDRDKKIYVDKKLKEETTAMSFHVKLGRLKNKGDWKLRYTYAQVGANAIHPSFGQNHWVAPGSGGGSALINYSGHDSLLTNYTGHGIEAFYACTKNSNVAFRTYQIATDVKDDRERERESSFMMLDYSVSFM